MSGSKRVRNPISNPEVFLVADSTSPEANLGYSNAEQVRSKLGVNNRVVETINSTSYTIKLADNGKILEFTSPAPITVTLPVTTTASLPVGFSVTITQKGSGRITFLPSTTAVNLRHPYNSNSTLGQFATCILYVSSPNEYILSGDTNNQGATAQSSVGQSSIISGIKEISDTETYLLLLTDNNLTLQINTSDTFYLLLPDDLPPGYNVEIFKIGSGRIILNPQGKSVISHPDLHNALTANFSKARLQVISSTPLNTLWSFTGDTSFINIELLNEYYNIELTGDVSKPVNPDLDITEIPFVFTVKKNPPQIPFKTFNVTPIGSNTGTPSGITISTGNWSAGDFQFEKTTLDLESGTIYSFIVNPHFRLEPDTVKFRIMRNGVPITSPEVITIDTSNERAAPDVFDSYTLTWNVPTNPLSSDVYTCGWHTGTSPIAATVRSINIINRSTSNIILNWSLTLIENISENDFVGDVIPQGSLSFVRSTDTEEKTFSVILKNVPNLTTEQQKLFRVTIVSVSSGVRLLNNFLDSRLSIYIPPAAPGAPAPDPSAFTGFLRNTIPITNISSLTSERFLLKVDSRTNTYDLRVNDFISIGKVFPALLSTGIETSTINSGNYLVTNIVTNEGQDTDVTIVKPVAYIIDSSSSSINIENENRTLVTLTVQWNGFVPPSQIVGYPIIVRGHGTTIANSFKLPGTDYIFRFAIENILSTSTVGSVTTQQITYIVASNPQYQNYPSDGVNRSGTIIDQNGNAINYSGTVTLEPLPFTQFINTSNQDTGVIEYLNNISTNQNYFSELLAIEILPRLNTITGSKMFTTSFGQFNNFALWNPGLKGLRDFRLAFQDSLEIGDMFSLTYYTQDYSFYLSSTYPEGIWKIVNIIPKRVEGLSRIVDLVVEYISPSVGNDKPYVGIARLLDTRSIVWISPGRIRQNDRNRLIARSHSTGFPIIETSLVSYTEGRAPSEVFGRVITSKSPQSYYSTRDILGFQIVGGNQQGFLNIGSTGELRMTTSGAQSFLNNAQQQPNEHIITVRTFMGDSSATRSITLRVLPAQ